MYNSFTVTVIDMAEMETVKSITGKSIVDVFRNLTFWMIATSLPEHFKVVLGTTISNNGVTASSFMTQEYQLVNGEPTLVE